MKILEWSRLGYGYTITGSKREWGGGGLGTGRTDMAHKLVSNGDGGWSLES